MDKINYKLLEHESVEVGDLYIANRFSKIIPTKITVKDAEGFCYASPNRSFENNETYENAAGIVIKVNNGNLEFCQNDSGIVITANNGILELLVSRHFDNMLKTTEFLDV